MKILELLEQIQSVIAPEAKFRGQFQPAKYSIKGGSYGTFARVVPDKKDPHMVIKNDTSAKWHSHNPDNYNKYISLLIERDLINSNIHFPRVYNIKKIVDKHGKFIFKYQMEKLIRLSELSEADLEILARNICSNISDGMTDRNLVNAIYDAIENECDGADRGGQRLISKSLKQCIQIINDIGEEIGVPPNDIGGDNIMVRRTPYGPQLVITDPFYG